MAGLHNPETPFALRAGNSPLDRGGGVSSGLRHSSPAGRAPLPTAAAPPLSPQSPEQPPGVWRFPPTGGRGRGPQLGPPVRLSTRLGRFPAKEGARGYRLGGAGLSGGGHQSRPLLFPILGAWPHRRSRSHLAARSFPESAGSGFPADPPVLRDFAGSPGPGTPTAAVGFQGPGVRIEPSLPTLVGPGCTPSPSPDLRSSELNTKSPAPCHTRRPHSPPTSARAARGDPSSLRALPPLPGVGQIHPAFSAIP